MPLAFQPIDRFGPVRNLELVVDFVDVLLDGAIGDAEELADFFVQQAFGQMLKDLLLPGRKGEYNMCAANLHFLELVKNPARDTGTHRGTAAVEFTNCCKYLKMCIRDRPKQVH